MIGYKITLDQKKQLEAMEHRGIQFNPVRDKKGNWFIFESEMQYLATNRSWNRAMLMEYIPPEPTEQELDVMG